MITTELEIFYALTLLAHGMIIQKLDVQDSQDLANEAVLKYTRKKQLPDIYSLWSLSPTAGLCLNILDQIGDFSKNDEKLLSLKHTFMAEDIEVLNRVIELVDNIKK